MAQPMSRQPWAYLTTTPDLDDIEKVCHTAHTKPNPRGPIRTLACCPPPSPIKAKDFVLPHFPMLRVRQPAHKLTSEYIEKYQKAIKAMRDLPDTDPHSWKQQGMIHCAYCNGAYINEGVDGQPDLEVRIHNSSLFYPFHRWYLYFYERILGKLIDDPTFALPYWNWDNPGGMTLPAMYEAPFLNKNDPRMNPLFDLFRNVGHLAPLGVDLEYDGEESGYSAEEQESHNLTTMYRQMQSDAPDTNTFFGKDPSLDPHSALSGSIEKGAHNSVHVWTGSKCTPRLEDMGTFYSAGYDPIFYAHHANIDRMWTIWKDLKPGHQDPSSNDWLNSSYVFYDENKELVRVKNECCVDTKLMGYYYEKSEIPWEFYSPTPTPNSRSIFTSANSFGTEKKVEEMKLPVKLDEIVKVRVKRPAINRTNEEKEKAKEMLFLNGINFDSEVLFKFDVLVNDVDNGIKTTVLNSEFAGSFIQVPHNHSGDKMFMTTGTAFGITDLLKDIEAEGDEYVVVTLVPRAGTAGATISKIKIELVPID